MKLGKNQKSALKMLKEFGDYRVGCGYTLKDPKVLDKLVEKGFVAKNAVLIKIWGEGRSVKTVCYSAIKDPT